MIRIVADNYVKPEGKEEFLKLAKELVEGTRREEGNISYHLHHDLSDEFHLTFIEEWKNMEAIRKHNASEHFTRIVPQLGQYAAKQGSCVLYEVIL